MVISLLVSELFGIGSEGNTSEATPVREKDDLAVILEKVSGVGKVEIYFHYGKSSGDVQENDLSFFQWTSDSRKDKEELVGILVVAEGASDKRIQNNLIRTLSSVLQISPHRIVIEEMEMEDK